MPHSIVTAAKLVALTLRASRKRNRLMVAASPASQFVTVKDMVRAPTATNHEGPSGILTATSATASRMLNAPNWYVSGTTDQKRDAAVVAASAENAKASR
jgi:hypothetical protein